MELGLYTFADMATDHRPGSATNTRKRMTELMEEIKLADQLCLDVFGIGEHHRPEYAVSAPAVVLGAAATLTKRIKLTVRNESGTGDQESGEPALDRQVTSAIHSGLQVSKKTKVV